MIDITAKLLTQWADEAGRRPVYPNAQFPPSLYYRFLQVLAEKLKPALSVELGVCGGGGSLHLALGNPDGLTVGVDVTPLPEPQAATLATACPNFRFWLGDSRASAAGIFERFGPCGLLFVDAEHTAAATLADFAIWQPYLAAGAVVCFDDLRREAMRGTWEALPGNKARLDWLHDGCEGPDGGFGCIWGL